MGKVLGTRSVDVEGEKVTYTVRRNGRIKGRGYSHWGECEYHGVPIKVEDHGRGLEQLDTLVQLECLTQKKKSKT